MEFFHNFYVPSNIRKFAFCEISPGADKGRLVAGCEDMLLTTKNVNPIIENSEG
jgi:hypothetical protein